MRRATAVVAATRALCAFALAALAGGCAYRAGGALAFPTRFESKEEASRFLAELADLPNVDSFLDELPFLKGSRDNTAAALLRDPLFEKHPADVVAVRYFTTHILGGREGRMRRDGAGWASADIGPPGLFSFWRGDSVFQGGGADTTASYSGWLLPFGAIGHGRFHQRRDLMAERPDARLAIVNVANGLWYREENNQRPTLLEPAPENEIAVAGWGLAWVGLANAERRLSLALGGAAWFARDDLATGDRSRGVLCNMFGWGNRGGRSFIRFFWLPLSLGEGAIPSADASSAAPADLSEVER